MSAPSDNPPQERPSSTSDVEKKADDEQSTRPPKKPLKDRVAATLKIVPFFGQYLEYLYSNHGIVVLAFAVLGFLSGWLIVYMGKAPYLCGTPVKVQRQVGQKPTKLTLGDPTQKPPWAEAYVKKFDLEGLSNQNSEGGQIEGLGADFFEVPDVTTNGLDSPPFRLKATAVESDVEYMIDGHAFRITADGVEGSNPQELIQYLPPQIDEPIKQTSIAFNVPSCKPGDRLAFVFRVQWKRDQKSPSNWMRSIQLEIQ
jgi:hypothetical protein